MSVNLNNSTDCCNTDCTNTTVNVPGPQGDAGAAGTNGTNGVDGVNAYSTVKAAITVPAVGQTINLYVVDHAAFSVNQILVISGFGHYLITHKGTDGGGGEYLGAQRLDYPNDTGSTGGTIAIGTEVSPAGPQGPEGGGSDQLTSQGDLLTRTSTAVSSLSAEGNGSALFTDPTAPTGLEWRDINFTDVNGKINLGTQTDTTTKLPLDRLTGPSDVTGDLAYYNGTSWARLPKGAEGRVLTVSNGVPAWGTSPDSSKAVRVVLTLNFPNDGTPKTITPDIGAINVSTASFTDTSGSSGGIYTTITVVFNDPVETSLPVLIQDNTIRTGGAGDVLTPFRVSSRSSSQIVFETIPYPQSSIVVSLIIFN